MPKALIGLLLVLLAACFGCGTKDSPARAEASSVASPDEIYRILEGNSQIGSPANAPPTLRDALPGSEFTTGIGEHFSSEAIAVGKVDTVDVASASVLAGPTDSPVPTGDPKADTYMLHLEMSVSDRLCAISEIPASITVAIPVHSLEAVEKMSSSLPQLGELAIFVRRADDGVYSPPLPELLSFVGPDGSLDWSVASETYGPDWSKGGSSISDLRSACP